jgi:hypothetical protein
MKKGYIFTLDAAFAVIIVTVLLFMVYNYSITSYSSAVDPLPIRRLASDIVAVLDYNGVLDTLDEGTIESELNQLLPPNMNMSITIYAYNDPSSLDDTIQINDDLTGDYFTGKWFSRTYTEGGKYLLVKYKVGLR